MYPALIISLLIVAALAVICFTLVSGRNRQLNTLKEDLSRADSDISRLTAELSVLHASASGTERSLEEAKKELASSRGTVERLISEKEALTRKNAELSTGLRFHQQEKARLEEENELRFKSLATEIIRQNSQTLKQQHEEHLDQILRPFKENIEQFKKTFADSYEKESRERFALDRHIQQLVELNRSIGREAQDLTRALRGNSKVQGDWGEMILEGILERSGLQRDREFSVQESTSSDDGRRLRADVVINYPDGRRAVIDSKVSLTDYVSYVNADDDDCRKACLSAHVRSVRAHIGELRDKKYQDYLGNQKADFVMMFIPNEGAYLAAMNADSRLWEEAYDSRVIIISPTHLISVIKLVEQLWQHDRQTKNAIYIAKAAGAMYDKFVGFVDDMSKIDKNISSTREAFDSAMKKLSNGTGNLVNRALKLQELGAKATKSLPQKYISDSEAENADI